MALDEAKITAIQSSVLVGHGLTKRYPGSVALDGLDIRVRAGEVRALVGMNGAGKSTLVKILSGAVRPDAGEIFVAGLPAHLDSPLVARNLGIATVYQEFSLVPELSVTENIMLGRWGKRAVINRRAIARQAEMAVDQLGVRLDLKKKVGRLSVADRQAVEIAKALSMKPHVLILDEPTSSLASHEILRLLSLVRRLASQGVCVIYVSHRIQEVADVADSVTVLRDGREVGTLPVADAPAERIVEMMIGGSWAGQGPARMGRPEKTRGVALSVRKLTWSDSLRNVNFDLLEGEVLGIAGLLGSGRTELLRCVYGLDKPDSGEVVVAGSAVDHRSPRRMVRHAVAMTPDDRKREGLVSGLSVADNLVLACLPRISRRGIILPGRRRRLASAACRQLGIKTPRLRGASRDA